MTLDGKSKEELSLLMDEKEKELRGILDNNSLVIAQILDIKKQIAELELRKSTLTIARTQGTYNKARVESELREIKNRYFRQ